MVASMVASMRRTDRHRPLRKAIQLTPVPVSGPSWALPDAQRLGKSTQRGTAAGLTRGRWGKGKKGREPHGERLAIAPVLAGFKRSTY